MKREIGTKRGRSKRKDILRDHRWRASISDGGRKIIPKRKVVKKKWWRGKKNSTTEPCGTQPAQPAWYTHRENMIIVRFIQLKKTVIDPRGKEKSRKGGPA